MRKSLNELREIVAETEHDARRFLGSDFSKLCDKSGVDGHHPADVRRNIRNLRARASDIIDKAQADKRDLNSQEEAAFNWLVAVADQDEEQLYLNDLAAQSLGRQQLHSSTSIFTKNQRISSESVSKNYDGMNVGTMLRAMALGSSGQQAIQDALSEGLDSSGGYTVPTHLLNPFLDRLRDALVLNQAGANTVILETMKTSMASVINDPVAGWRAENSPVTVSDATFGTILFQPKSLAVLVKVSRELLQDSLNIDEILMNTLASAIALELDHAGLYGSGQNNEPLGLKSVLSSNGRQSAIATNGGKLSGNGNWKPLINAMQRVGLNNDKATAGIMNPRTFYDLSALTDTTGQPLATPKVIENMQMLDTNSVPVDQDEGTSLGVCSEAIVGNFSNMHLGLRQELRIEILREAFASNMQVAFLAHLRADWQCVRPNSFWSLTGILAE